MEIFELICFELNSRCQVVHLEINRWQVVHLEIKLGPASTTGPNFWTSWPSSRCAWNRSCWWRPEPSSRGRAFPEVFGAEWTSRRRRRSTTEAFPAPDFLVPKSTGSERRPIYYSLTSDLSLTNQSQALLQVHATQVDGRLLWWMYAICERECSVYILKISTSARYYKDATKQGRDLEL